MGQKSKNAGKKKQMPAKAKVSCLPHNRYLCSSTPEARKAFLDIFLASGVDVDGTRRATLHLSL